MIQEMFDVTIDLIEQQGKGFSFLSTLLYVYRSGALVFSFFKHPSVGNRRENVLAGVGLKIALLPVSCSIEGERGALTALREAKYEHICVAIFITQAGTFTVFSDFERKELIGALYESEAPEDVPGFSHLFMNGKLLSRER